MANFELTEGEAQAAKQADAGAEPAAAAAAAMPKAPAKLWTALLAERHEQQQAETFAQLGRGRRMRREVNYADAGEDDAKGDADERDPEFDEQAAAGLAAGEDDDDSEDESPAVVGPAAAAALQSGRLGAEAAAGLAEQLLNSTWAELEQDPAWGKPLVDMLRRPNQERPTQADVQMLLAEIRRVHGAKPADTAAANAQYLCSPAQAHAQQHVGAGAAAPAHPLCLQQLPAPLRQALQTRAAQEAQQSGAPASQQLPALCTRTLDGVAEQISVAGGAWTVCGLAHDARMLVLAHVMRRGLPLCERRWDWGAAR